MTKKKTNQHGKHKPNYYQENKQKYFLANQKYRAKLKIQKPPKLSSIFQQTKQKQLLKLLVNQKSFVPVPQKLKHPIIKKWNADNYWYFKYLWQRIQKKKKTTDLSGKKLDFLRKFPLQKLIYFAFSSMWTIRIYLNYAFWL